MADQFTFFAVTPLESHLLFFFSSSFSWSILPFLCFVEIRTFLQKPKTRGIPRNSFMHQISLCQKRKQIPKRSNRLEIEINENPKGPPKKRVREHGTLLSSSGERDSEKKKGIPRGLFVIVNLVFLNDRGTLASFVGRKSLLHSRLTNTIFYSQKKRKGKSNERR